MNIIYSCFLYKETKKMNKRTSYKNGEIKMKLILALA